MAKNLDKTFAQWFHTMQEVNPAAIECEINNRIEPFNTLRAILLTDAPIDPQAFFAEAQKTTPITSLSRYNRIIVRKFFNDEELARHMLTRLARKLPRSSAAAITIDATIEEVIPKTKLDPVLAALTFSLILTAAHPDRFVDYPAHTDWEAFAKRLEYAIPRTKSYGSRFIWASMFARKIAQTPTYQQIWPGDQPRFQHPLWIIAALPWANKEMETAAPEKQRRR